MGFFLSLGFIQWRVLKNPERIPKRIPNEGGLKLSIIMCVCVFVSDDSAADSCVVER